MSDPTVVSTHPAGGEGSDLTSCSTGASTPPKRAHAVVAEAATAQQKKHARPLPAADDEAAASLECAIEDEDEPEDVQGRVDRALATFIARHGLNAEIFCSDEWDSVLEAVNCGPLPPINACDVEPAAALLLARASIHQFQAAWSREAE